MTHERHSQKHTEDLRKEEENQHYRYSCQVLIDINYDGIGAPSAKDDVIQVRVDHTALVASSHSETTLGVVMFGSKALKGQRETKQLCGK